MLSHWKRGAAVWPESRFFLSRSQHGMARDPLTCRFLQFV